MIVHITETQPGLFLPLLALAACCAAHHPLSITTQLANRFLKKPWRRYLPLRASNLNRPCTDKRKGWAAKKKPAVARCWVCACVFVSLRPIVWVTLMWADQCLNYGCALGTFVVGLCNGYVQACGGLGEVAKHGWLKVTQCDMMRCCL